MKFIKRKLPEPSETRIIIEYYNWTDELGDYEDYILGKKKLITGYDSNRELHKMQLKDIFYFEAVGDLIFAYTQESQYEMKMRLYQVEENVAGTSITRASKSILVNIDKIDSIRTALNGRLYATLENGEDILVSRQYSKELMRKIKES